LSEWRLKDLGFLVLRNVVDYDAQRAGWLDRRGSSERFARQLLVCLAEFIARAGVQALMLMDFTDTHSFTS
jgi:hypothetical protein